MYLMEREQWLALDHANKAMIEFISDQTKSKEEASQALDYYIEVGYGDYWITPFDPNMWIYDKSTRKYSVRTWWHEDICVHLTFIWQQREVAK